MYQTFCKPAEDGNNTAVMSPDSAGRESHLGSCETSRRGSTENDCSSLSSGEMVIRSNSFCLEDQSYLVVSSLQDSSMSLAAGHPASPTESNLLSATLLDGCEKSTERVTEANTSHPGLGMTFIQTELPTEENDMAASNSLLALPTESQTGLLMTFVCETSPADGGKEAQCASAEAQLLHFPGAVTPEQGKAFVSTLSVVQDADKDIHTSTPIQNTGNMIPSLPSFSESPCTGNTGSPGLHPVKQQQISVTPKKRLVAGLLPPSSKVKKMEINKFPKVDYSNVKSKSSAASHVAADKHASAVQCSNAASEIEHAALSQEGDAPAQHAGNQTFCLSPLEKSPDQGDQTETKPTPKKAVANKTEVRSGSVSGHDKPSVLKTWLRCSSDSSVSSRPPKEKRPALRFSASFSIPKADAHVTQTKQGNQSRRAIQAEATNGPAENSTREVKKISLVVESSKSTTAGASCDENKSRFRARPSPRQTRAPPSQAPSASPRPTTLSTRQRQATLGKDECRTPKAVEATAQTKQKNITGNQRAREPSHGTALTASIKPQLNGSRPPQTPIRPSPMGSRSTPASRPLRKTLGPSRSVTETCVNTEQTEGAGSTQVSGGAAHKSTPFKNVVQKARLLTTPAKNTGPGLYRVGGAGVRPAAAAMEEGGMMMINVVATLNACSFTVNKNKPKAGARQQHPQQQASQQSQSNGPPDVVPASVAEGEREDLSIQQLRGLLAASNGRFEALAIVLQQTLAERDEATRQRRDLSQELVNLREELVCSIHSSERLEKEKDELRVALEDALQKLQEQHQKDLAELEQRLQTFYQAEWDKIHFTYQEEADKCKTLMQHQMDELKANHEAVKLDLENSHTEQLQCVKQQYEMSLDELSKAHNQELQSLDKTLKDAEAALSGQIEALTAENKALIEKLTAEANRRRELADKSQKDSHTVYLEQELESLKVVLDIKNKQLHQQEKKLMEIDKLKEKNVKLDEIFKKVQQENEDLKARMDRHAALSRQLSTEQAVLQESLQKESKVNKRLSMENEELLWKLHNGDLSSPRKVSPTSTTSPSHSFSLQSPRTSGLFSSPPLSPR
ncbi:Microtubule-associated tumor suppressor 1-like protein A [Nibea albiflora]|uniref:Microtubule-associated tumor suppressor 1-like protein A n=1 Tax=Nibea albiflora TaxID=240163 RepID=A0ACB7EPT9_NIBAL|nr:Microtubule-associated tumor suppressor 1-like protein A [Nibea albiflora]